MTTDALVRASSRLGEQTLLSIYWTMLLSRRLDERAWALHRQGKIHFHISAMGQEAAQVGAAFAIQRGVDYVNPYYRDLALSIAIGITPFDIMMSLFAKQGEYSSGGRQMPAHFNSRRLNLVGGSSVVATQVPQTAGLAFAIKYRQKTGLADPADATQPRVALTCLGEGSTSQGEWHEGMNWAGVHRLPMICLVQNNAYAISVPVDSQMAVANVADRAAGYGIPGVVVDGNDVLAVYDAVREAVERAYAGEGATLIEAKTYRLTPHSSDDDDRSYRTREEVELWKGRDPIPRFRQYLQAEGILSPEQAEAYERRARVEVDSAQAAAEAAPDPSPEEALGAVYAPAEGGS
ncbi:MAG: thiamine pyrophosphate-dependent dehydrogenase E1 component subunit alpha [Anaerolineae bacterium]|nr:thiamine pyrophosphate-dependent dehydrogenase E1 component subunit alpha [Anaerolineae bacterium]NUQ06548.1 thiamine pyrophosphate-dependent dehydrogenase E1 component subunit alpha [Anaerolineae bacterium]